MTEAKEKHDMFWADQIAREAVPFQGKHVVGDAKTPSGRIHVGSLRGVIIHDLIYKALKDSGANARYIYRFDDLDPMDGFPPDLPEEFKKHMGEPLCNVPSPEKGFDSLAQYYALDFKEVFEKLDSKPEIVWASESYRKGKMNDLVRVALERSREIRDINVRISGAKKAEDWLPINVICEKCGKIGTTKVSDYDGTTVAYECVGAKYAEGCKHNARISPFNGNAKLTWKAEWAAQFSVYNVTVEGAGKDHYAAGGSRDVANEISKTVFNYSPPYNFPYEFFLLEGRKMSSSKGVGVSARDVASLLPPQLLRFLLTRYKPRTAINFNPSGETVPRLFDDYDKFARIAFGHETSNDPDVPRLFALSAIGKEHDCYRAQFSFVASLVQIPGANVEELIAKHKGASLTAEEKAILNERMEYARKWLQELAPEEAKLTILSAEAGREQFAKLPTAMQSALNDFASQFAKGAAGPDAVKAICTAHNVSTAEFFASAYTIVLGRQRGPKLMPMLDALGAQFVRERFAQT